MTAPLILDIGLVLLAAAAGGWLARRVGLPAVVGYLAVGLLVSPFTQGYVAGREQVHLLADVGVALLLVAPIQVAITLVASVAAVAGLVPAGWFAATLGAVVITIAASAVLARIVGPRLPSAAHAPEP